MVPRDRLATLFLPDLHYGPPAVREPLRQGEPLRLAFFGRIMPYKGLLMFVETMERLRAAGVNVQVGVFGEGALGTCAGRLKRLGAKVVNRWLGDEEVGRILSGYHALVLSHIEASQSAVVATAFGLGLPVVATRSADWASRSPTVKRASRRTGDAQALAEAVMRLLDPDMYSRHLQDHCREQRNSARCGALSKPAACTRRRAAALRQRRSASTRRQASQVGETGV